MALSMVLLAMRGGASHVRRTDGGWARKTRVACSLAFLFLRELLDFVALLPSMSRNLLLYASLPSASRIRSRSRSSSSSGGGGGSVSILRNIRYGDAPRNL
jgi:uncharacterized membrane protein YgcG